MAVQSPFIFGKLANQKHFVNREEEKEMLRKNLEGGINTILISPRRWGKSSLVKEVSLLSAKNEKFAWCFIDMFAIRNERELYETIAKEVLRQTASKQENILNTAGQFFKTLIPKFSYSLDPVTDLSVSLDWAELKKSPSDVLNLPEKIAIKKKIKIIICIDEFQQITTFDKKNTIEKILRSHWQHHQHVSYCLYGSKRHMMTEIFDKKSNAFYRFGQIVFLQKISKPHWLPYIISTFKQHRIILPERVANDIVEAMNEHPYYVQQLCFMLWTMAEKTIDKKLLDKAIATIITLNEPLFQQEFDNLSNTQVSMLKAILDGESMLSSQKLIHKYNLGSPRLITKNKNSLINDDIIAFQNKKFEFIDPVFALWLHQIFM
jgi:AAA+ ATPase superfamily predicted ATPase